MAEQNPQPHEEESPETASEAQSAAPDAATDESTDAAPNSDSGSDAGPDTGSGASDPTPEEALEAASRAADEINRETGDPGAETDSASNAAQPTDALGGEPLDLENFSADAQANGNAASPAGLNLLDDIDLQVTVELGRTRMYIEDVLRLNENSVVELDKAAGDSVDVYVNDRLVARGEVLVLNENFCVRINEIISQKALDDCEVVGVSEKAS